ncbi:MAG TPA: beta-ketoacyl-ACP synthase III [Chthonomonadales bacterium]|nr:beta-ketoacyl-ACP synthase III [Chthonomonadales bacterium]
MQSSRNAGIEGVGMALPQGVLTNADLERMVDTSDEWIVARTGIRERRICGPEDTTSSLSLAAARRALDNAGCSPDELDLIICGTATGDYIWPATACIVQEGLGARKAGAFDLTAACSGFVYAIEVASSMVRSGSVNRVLVLGADTLTKLVDWEDRSTCVLFGDAAGAAVVGPCAPGEGILASALKADGGGLEHILLRAGGTRHRITPELIERKWDRIYMRGTEVYKFAVRAMADACIEALLKAGLTVDDVDLFIPHQANLRIVRAAAERMRLPEERIYVNIEKYGNTSAASVPVALTEALEEGRVRRGDILVFVGFGAGLTWGANVVRWSA